MSQFYKKKKRKSQIKPDGKISLYYHSQMSLHTGTTEIFASSLRQLMETHEQFQIHSLKKCKSEILNCKEFCLLCARQMGAPD